MLRWRLLLGTLIVAALVFLAARDCGATVPGLWLLPAAVVFTILGSQEIIGLLQAGGLRPSPGTVYFGNLLLLLVNWMPRQLWGVEIHPGQWMTVALVIVLFLAFAGAIVRYRAPGGSIGGIAATCFAVLYVGLMFAFLVQLRIRWGVGALASLLVVVKLGDIGAYTVGRLVGRHKMAPRLSPGKTLEGACGALIFSVLGSWAAFLWLVPLASDRLAPRGPWWGWLLFGLILGAAGMFGDLAESLLKRDVGRKDSSTWLPGYGGVLDMIDSPLLAAPVAWLCWYFGLVW